MEIIKVSGEPNPEGFIFLENIPKDWWNIDVLVLQTLADAGYAIRFNGDATDVSGTKRPEQLKVMVSHDEEAKIRQVHAKLKGSNSGLLVVATIQGNAPALENLVKGKSAEIGVNRHIHSKNFVEISRYHLRSFFVTAFERQKKSNGSEELSSREELLLASGLADIREQLGIALDQILKQNPRLAPQPKNQNE